MVNGVEDFWQLHANGGQVVYVKKAAVIDLLGSDSPKGQTIRLRVQQFVQFVETARVARIPVDLCEGFFDCVLYLRCLRTTSLQPPFNDFLLSRAFCDSLRVGLSALGQVFKCGQNAL